MENASEALIMAASVLIFIIALTVTISSFSEVRAGIDRMISQTETVELAESSQGYVNYMKANTDTTRVVGAETVVSSMYRSLKERYVVYIQLEDYSSIKDKVTLLTSKENKQIFKITLNTNDHILDDKETMKNFYNQIKDYIFTEYLGEYQSNSDVASENKPTYRIITYIQR